MLRVIFNILFVRFYSTSTLVFFWHTDSWLLTYRQIGTTTTTIVEHFFSPKQSPVPVKTCSLLPSSLQTLIYSNLLPKCYINGIMQDVDFQSSSFFFYLTPTPLRMTKLFCLPTVPSGAEQHSELQTYHGLFNPSSVEQQLV